MGFFDIFRSKPLPAALVPVDNSPPQTAPVKITFKRDSWQNDLTGLGTARDKVTYGAFVRTLRITDPELSALYHGDDMAAKIVEVPPQEMLRRGYDITLKGEDGEEDDSSDTEDDLLEKGKDLRLDTQVLEAMIWGRLFGGALLIIGADDGQDPTKPLAEDRIKTIRFLNVVDRRFVFVHTYYTDPMSAKYGQPEVYYIVNALGGGSSMAAVSYVHESRVIRFGGAPTDVLERRALAGWDYSVLQRCYDAVRAFATGYQATAHLMTDAGQAHMKIPGLANMIANDSNTLAVRMQAVDMARSTARMVLLDEGEEFGRENTTFSGLADLLDRYQQRLAAAAEIPVAILMGRSAAGLNATGESDIRSFYGRISSLQTNYLKPILTRLYTLIAMSADGPAIGDAEIEICFRPLWEPSDIEQATYEKMIADRDVAYITAEVLTPEEVAISRFGSGKFDPTTNIDVKARKAAQAGATAFDPYEADTKEAADAALAQAQGEPNSPAAPPVGQAAGEPVPPPGGTPKPPKE